MQCHSFLTCQKRLRFWSPDSWARYEGYNCDCFCIGDLVGGLEHLLFFHIGNSNPNWLIFFRGVAQPPTSSASWITNFLLFKPSDCWWTHLFFLLFLAFWAMIKEAPRYWFKQQKITFFWWIYYFYWWNHHFSYLFVSEITMSVAKHRLFSLQKISAISSRRKRTWTGPLWCLWSLARPLHWVHFFIFPRGRLLGQS